MTGYVGIPRWLPVSLQTDAGVPVPGLAAADVTFNYQIDTEVAVELGGGTTPLFDDTTWVGIGEGKYRFLFTPAEAGMVVYWVEEATSVTYEGAIDILPAGLYSTALTPGYYCNYADMQAELTVLSDLFPTGLALTEENWVKNRIAKAQQAIVDPLLAEKGYIVPVVTPWASLRGITVNATAYEILRPLKVRQDPAHNADWADTYLQDVKDALKVLPPADPDGLIPDLPVSIWGDVSSNTSGREQGPFTLPQFDDVQEETTTVW
jgi:hypothetical protein